MKSLASPKQHFPLGLCWTRNPILMIRSDLARAMEPWFRKTSSFLGNTDLMKGHGLWCGHCLGSVLTLQWLYNLRQEVWADPYSLQIPYVWVCLLVGIHCYKAMPMMLLQSSQDTHRAVAVLRCPGNTCPVKVKQGSTLPSCLSSHSVNKCHFTVYLLPCFPHFYAFCLWLPFKISLKCSIGRMSNVTESKEAVQCLLKKRNRQERMVWDKVKLRIRGSSGNPMRFSKEGSDKIF